MVSAKAVGWIVCLQGLVDAHLFDMHLIHESMLPRAFLTCALLPLKTEQLNKERAISSEIYKGLCHEMDWAFQKIGRTTEI